MMRRRLLQTVTLSALAMMDNLQPPAVKPDNAPRSKTPMNKKQQKSRKKAKAARKAKRRNR